MTDNEFDNLKLNNPSIIDNKNSLNQPIIPIIMIDKTFDNIPYLPHLNNIYRLIKNRTEVSLNCFYL